MVQLRGRLGLPAETLHEARIRGVRLGQHLDGDGPAQEGVGSLVDVGHPPTAPGRRNRAGIKPTAGSGGTPGLLAYMDGRPVGWVSVAPREEFGKIGRARSTKPVDDKPAWSIVCFYIDRHHRGDGVGTALL